MHRENIKSKLILVICLIILLCLSVGYAAFQTSLNVKGNASITSDWNIEITGVQVINTTGNGENASSPSWTKTTANMEANLYEPGDSVKYKVTVQNKGDLEANLQNVITNKDNNESVKITCSGYTLNETLKPNATKDIVVDISYNPEYNGGDTSSEAQIVVECVQANH